VTIGKGTIDVMGPLMVIGIVWAAEVGAHAVIICATVTTGGAIEMPALVASDTCKHFIIWSINPEL
jgi:hypothetical protein